MKKDVVLVRTVSGEDFEQLVASEDDLPSRVVDGEKFEGLLLIESSLGTVRVDMKYSPVIAVPLIAAAETSGGLIIADWVVVASTIGGFGLLFQWLIMRLKS